MERGSNVWESVNHRERHLDRWNMRQTKWQLHTKRLVESDFFKIDFFSWRQDLKRSVRRMLVKLEKVVYGAHDALTVWQQAVTDAMSS